jgi:hypothetical protein
VSSGTDNAWAGLPGEELVREGLEDLARGKLSEAGLLVLIAEPRLRAAGVSVRSACRLEGPPEHALYGLLEQTRGPDAFSRYNSLLRRMASFARALERERVSRAPG